jgi:hypothetical protein
LRPFPEEPQAEKTRGCPKTFGQPLFFARRTEKRLGEKPGTRLVEQFPHHHDVHLGSRLIDRPIPPRSREPGANPIAGLGRRGPGFLGPSGISPRDGPSREIPGKGDDDRVASRTGEGDQGVDGVLLPHLPGKTEEEAHPVGVWPGPKAILRGEGLKPGVVAGEETGRREVGPKGIEETGSLSRQQGLQASDRLKVGEQDQGRRKAGAPSAA